MPLRHQQRRTHTHVYSPHSHTRTTQIINKPLQSRQFFGKCTLKNSNINAHKLWKSAEKFIISPFFALFCFASSCACEWYFCGFDEDEVRVIGTRKEESPFFSAAYSFLYSINVDGGDMNFFNKIVRNRVKNIITHTHTTHTEREREWHKIVIIATINTWGSSCALNLLSLCVFVCVCLSLVLFLSLSPISLSSSPFVRLLSVCQ